MRGNVCAVKGRTHFFRQGKTITGFIARHVHCCNWNLISIIGKSFCCCVCPVLASFACQMQIFLSYFLLSAESMSTKSKPSPKTLANNKHSPSLPVYWQFVASYGTSCRSSSSHAKKSERATTICSKLWISCRSLSPLADESGNALNCYGPGFAVTGRKCQVLRVWQVPQSLTTLPF